MKPSAAASPGAAPETTTYMEMLSREELRPSATNRGALHLRRAAPAEWQLGKSLYEEVGEQWLWIDRLTWRDEAWREYYRRPGIELWVAEADGAPAGYFELSRDGEGNTELAYFGLLAHSIGRGLGGLLLTLAIEQAWNGGARRVWVHTSSRDHEHALANYLARGFRVYHTETRNAPARNPVSSQ
jgi:GNAT superfamily N-acetyltransferase